MEIYIGYEWVHLPFSKVADTPFYIQSNDMLQKTVSENVTRKNCSETNTKAALRYRQSPILNLI